MNIWIELKLNDEKAKKIMKEIYDQYGNEISSVNNKSEFEEVKDGRTYIKGFQGYKEHNPVIQSFANSNADNFAQTVLFGPLTANTSFARFNEWFPVLMAFLKKRDKVTATEVGNFAASMHSEKQGIPGGGLFVSIIDRGERHKTKLIEYVWNNREELKKECDELAAQKRFKDLLYKFSTFPGIQPVKAGFVIQLLYGQMGCMDSHNIAMYTALSAQMKNDKGLKKEDREKWLELENKLKEGKRTWIAASGKGEDESGVIKLEKSINAYDDILNFMNKEMGFTPRVLWDLWCNYVGQRYEPKKAYSPNQGLIYPKDDPQLLSLFGGKDRQWYNSKSGRNANVIEPHPTSGAVSRVHLMTAISPEDLFIELEREGNNPYHIYNAALRTDLNVKSALQIISNRLKDLNELEVLIATGGRVNSAIAFAKENNKNLLEQLTRNAINALIVILGQKYPTLNKKNIKEMVDIYVNEFKKLYKLHTKEVLTAIKSSNTKTQKAQGTYEKDDEEIGHGAYDFNPKTPFDVKTEKGKKNTNKIISRLDMYKDTLQDISQSSLAMKETESNLIKAKEKLTKLKERKFEYKSLDDYLKDKNKLMIKIKELSDKLGELKRIHKENLSRMKKDSNEELAVHSDVARKRLHHIPNEEDEEDDF